MTKPKFSGDGSGFLAGDEAKLLRYELYPTSCLAFRREAVGRLLPIPERLRIQADGQSGDADATDCGSGCGERAVVGVQGTWEQFVFCG